MAREATVFFVKWNEAGREELWSTNGTAKGTKAVMTVPANVAGLDLDMLTTVPNGTKLFGFDSDAVYFTINFDLWMSDGRSEGTRRVGDMGGPISELTPYYASGSSLGTLYFTGEDGNLYGPELWSSNGTEATTRIVKDINPGIGGSSPYNLTVVDNNLYFMTRDELWRSNGVASGTVRVADIVPEGAPISGGGQLVAQPGTGWVYFTAWHPQAGLELWRTSATAGGPYLLTNILSETATSGPRNSIGSDLYAFNGGIYFTASWPVGEDGSEPALTSYSGSGTSRIAAGFSFGSAEVGTNTMYLVGGYAGSADGIGLWRSTGGAPSKVTAPTNFMPQFGEDSSLVIHEQLLFAASDESGAELWGTNGTTAFRVADINPGAGSSDPQNFAQANGKLYFVATDGAMNDFGNIYNLYRYDPFTGGLTMLAEDVDETAELAVADISDIGPAPTKSNDTLTGTDGADRINGLGGKDRISGGPGNDTLIGGAGNDRLSGGLGLDTLTGGKGSASRDIFVFDTIPSKKNVDTIKDFERKYDQIFLDDAVFKGLGTGTAAGTPIKAGMFAANKTGGATSDDAQITYETDTGKLFYDKDGAGGARAVHFATLSGKPSIGFADFEII